MVCIVIVEGERQVLALAQGVLNKASACAPVRPGVWLIEDSLGTADWRNRLASNLPGTQIFVAQLAGGWSERGYAGPADWLRQQMGRHN